MICIRCEKEHDGTFGSGRFCSNKCSKSRVHSIETKSKISKKLAGRTIGLIPENICTKCGSSFQKKLRKDRKVLCSDCGRKRVSIRTGEDFLLSDLSTRTITKIFKRAKIGCSICGWDESTGDTHHIIEKKNGGNESLSNLVYVCPNHHRIIHSEKTFTKEFLLERSLQFQLPNWKDFYNKK